MTAVQKKQIEIGEYCGGRYLVRGSLCDLSRATELYKQSASVKDLVPSFGSGYPDTNKVPCVDICRENRCPVKK